MNTQHIVDIRGSLVLKRARAMSICVCDSLSNSIRLSACHLCCLFPAVLESSEHLQWGCMGTPTCALSAFTVCVLRCSLGFLHTGHASACTNWLCWPREHSGTACCAVTRSPSRTCRCRLLCPGAYACTACTEATDMHLYWKCTTRMCDVALV